MNPMSIPKAAPVRFRFKNLGPVKEAELELGDLTIIAGRNNTGKTYLVYTLYGFLKMWGAWPRAEEYFLEENTSKSDSTLQSSSIAAFIREAVVEGRARRRVDRETLNQERNAVIRELAHDFSRSALARVFSSPSNEFQGSSISVELNGEFPETRSFKITLKSNAVFSIDYDGTEIVMTCGNTEEDGGDDYLRSYLSDLYLQFLFPEFFELSSEQFVLSAERFGISLFYKELDFTKNRLVELLQQMGDDKNRETFSPFFLIDSATSRYALPIKDNIEYTRDISNIQKEKSEIAGSKLFDDIKDMIEGYYRSSQDDIRFISKARKERSFSIPLHRASSSARGLSDLYFFLRHTAKRNHLLIIDEPESHLDTANQIEFARLLARLVRSGVKVLVTTHSDYIIKEINNLVMLSRPFEGKSKIVKKLKYKRDDFLSPESIRAYVAKDSSLFPCDIDQFGFEFPVFDETINQINRVSNELASRLLTDGEE